MTFHTCYSATAQSRFTAAGFLPGCFRHRAALLYEGLRAVGTGRRLVLFSTGTLEVHRGTTSQPATQANCHVPVLKPPSASPYKQGSALGSIPIMLEVVKVIPECLDSARPNTVSLSPGFEGQ